MVLHPLTSGSETTGGTLPVWDAILRRQKMSATEWLLVAQADHAQLSGELAAQVSHPALPTLDKNVIQAIALHDEGWKILDDLESPRTNHGRPLSFLEMPPQEIFQAWRGSIDRATQVGPLPGILVSEHFCRIARDFAHAATTPPELAQVLTTFMERELDHQEDLRTGQSASAEEITLLVDALQFFDLLSLYICCGARETIEFPQRFGGESFRLHAETDLLRLEPNVFPKEFRLSLKAGRYPGGSEPVTLPVRLA